MVFFYEMNQKTLSLSHPQSIAYLLHPQGCVDSLIELFNMLLFSLQISL